MLDVYCDTDELDAVKETLEKAFPGCSISKVEGYGYGKRFQVSRPTEPTEPLEKRAVLKALAKFERKNVVEAK